MPPIGTTQQLNLLGIPTLQQNEPIDPRTGAQAPLLPGGFTTAPPVDTQAAADAAAAAAKTAALRNTYVTNANSIVAGGRQSATDTGNTYDANNRSFLNTLDTNQSAINSAATNNALNLRRSMASIASGVRTGLRSGGVTLGNMNALDSGAAEALARAWARVGNQQSGSASNQAQLVSNDLTSKQGALTRQKDDTLTGFGQFKDAEINRISQDLLSKLQVLDAQAQQAGAGSVVDMGARDSIINDAVARLNQIDQMRNDRLANIHGLTPEEVQQQAVQMDQAGAVASNPFAIEAPTVGAPTGSGAEISQLPIFTRRRTA